MGILVRACGKIERMFLGSVVSAQQLSLWSSVPAASAAEMQRIALPDGDLLWCEQFLPRSTGAGGAMALPTADSCWAALLSETPWQQDWITLYGKRHPLPRLTAWYGDAGTIYTYSGITMQPQAWTPTLLALKTALERVAQTAFNSVLLNYYRTGQDSMGWHSDDEPELGPNPIIASLSLGGTRRFVLRHRCDRTVEKVEFALGHGSLLIMQGTTQHFWQHQVPKTAKPTAPRINLTFRAIHHNSP